ncbi:MAG: PadR family transcriptional regulator [Candidatus Bathyarchaeota archaeon]
MGPNQGYGIIKTFTKRMEKEFSPGLVYPFLQRPEEKGFVTQSTEMVGEKEKKVYCLTQMKTALCERQLRRFANLVSVALEPGLDIYPPCGYKIYGGHLESSMARKRYFAASTHPSP